MQPSFERLLCQGAPYMRRSGEDDSVNFVGDIFQSGCCPLDPELGR